MMVLPLRVRLRKSRGEQIESACPQAADVRDDPTEGPGWAKCSQEKDSDIIAKSFRQPSLA